MGIAYSVAFFITTGIFLAATCIWSIYRGVDDNVVTVQTRFRLGNHWKQPLRIVAYWQIAMTGLMAIVALSFAAAFAWMAAN